VKLLDSAGKANNIGYIEVIVVCKVKYEEGEDGCHHRVVLAHCASCCSASGVLPARRHFLLLQSTAGAELTEVPAGTLVKYVAKPVVQSTRCLPCHRRPPTCGMLVQYDLDDFVHHMIRPSVWGPAARVDCSRVQHTKVMGDAFLLGLPIEELSVQGVAPMEASAAAGDGSDSDLDWVGSCRRSLATGSANGLASPEPQLAAQGPHLDAEELVDDFELLAPDGIIAREVQGMLEDEAEIVDEEDFVEEGAGHDGDLDSANGAEGGGLAAPGCHDAADLGHSIAEDAAAMPEEAIIHAQQNPMPQEVSVAIRPMACHRSC